MYYPSPYERLVSNYKHVNTDLIKRFIEYFDCEKALSYLDVNKQVSVFNDTIMSFLKTFSA